MMNLRQACVALVALLLASLMGCGSTQAQKLLSNLETKLTTANENLNSCDVNYRSAYANELSLIEENLIRGPSDPQKVQKLTNKSFPTPEEKKALVEVTNSYDCQQNFANELRQINVHAAQAWDVFLDIRLNTKLSMIEGKLTWGQYNNMLLQQVQEHTKTLNEIGARTAAELEQMHASEMQARQARWAAASAAFAQGAANAQINGPTYTNCYGTGNSATCNQSGPGASYRTANCTRIGNQINCSSY
jgi:uncharacterized lipoprotein YehR (DUF1307 family)